MRGYMWDMSAGSMFKSGRMRTEPKKTPLHRVCGVDVVYSIDVHQ